MPTPLTKDRNTCNKDLGRVQSYQVAAATVIFKGALCAVNAAGHLVPAINTAGFVVVGVAEHFVDNTAGAAGDLSANCRKGVFAFNGEGGDLPTQALVGHAVYAASDNEVELTAGNAVMAGTLEEIDGADYWVSIFDQAIT
jgi:hypothetical protein